MKLTISERFTLLGLLPQQGSLLTIKTISQLRDTLLLSEDEIAKWGVTQDGDQLRWDPKQATEADLTFSPGGASLIVNELQALEQKQHLTPAHLPLWEKFVGGE